jgi:hypothetical protein
VTAALAGLRRANRAATIDTLLSAAVEDAGAPGRDPVYGLGILTLSPEVSLAQSGDGNRH